MIDDLVKRLRNPPFGTETSERSLMAYAADRIIAQAATIEALRARVAKADGLAEAFAAVLELENNTSPFGGEIMRDRIERTVRKAVSALDAYRATEGAKP